MDRFQTRWRSIGIFIRLLPLFSFIAAFVLLYFLYPTSYEGDPTWEGFWQGRFFYIFFLWLASLELILNWERLTSRITKLRDKRTMAFIAALLLPTIFVIAANFWGLNTIIKEVAIRNSVPHANLMPLTFEYFIFAVLFILINLMSYGVNCLGDFSLSSFFLGIIGMLYTIDNLYPTGQFTPFQILVPATATLSANLLGFLGYQPIWLSANQGMPTLMVMDSQRRFSCAFSIAWPCAGVESLILYTITILLFLNKIVTSRWQRVIYFAIGAAITYFINILRIATIFIISIPCGATNEWVRFHNIYGSLYSITWITAFPLIIMGSQALWKTFRKRKTGPTTTSNLKIS